MVSDNGKYRNVPRCLFVMSLNDGASSTMKNMTIRINQLTDLPTTTTVIRPASQVLGPRSLVVHCPSSILQHRQPQTL